MADDYVENWTDWSVHVEFWQMYRSSQFLNYRSLWEDLDDGTDDARPRPSPKVLSVGSAIYTITEIFELLFRMFRNGQYEGGALLTFSLENTFHRHLWINEANRLPFSDEKVTGAERIVVARNLSASDLAEASSQHSLSATLEVFTHFGWDTNESVLARQQTRFLRRQA